MPSPRKLSRLLCAALLGALLPAAAGAQTREVVSKQIGVGRAQASLRLEFAQGDPLSIRFDDGSIELNDQTIGSYDRGDALDTAWRELLGDAVSLDDGALAQRLRDWTPPGKVAGSEAEAAQRLDRALEDALSASAAPNAPAPPSPPGAPADMDRAMRALVGRPRRLQELGRAIEDLDLSRVQVHVGEDVRVAEGETIPGSVVVVDGDLELKGEIDGSVVIVGGALHLDEGGRVTGDVHLSDARIFRDGGEVEGDVSNVRFDRGDVDRDRIRDEIRRELREEIRGRERSMGPLGRTGRELGELLGILLGVIVMGVLGGGTAVYFAREQMEVVAEAARKAPLRAGAVGLAGAFLTLPAFVLGGLALIVTIVGILALPFWLVLFPVALCLALIVGYLAIAQSVGEWVARQRFSNLDWVRVSNPYTTVFAGVVALSLWLIVAHVIELFGFLRFVSVLLHVLGAILTCVVALIGFGAVLLTRGGRRPAYADASSWGDPWDDEPGYGGSSPSPAAPETPVEPPAQPAGGSTAEPPDTP